MREHEIERGILKRKLPSFGKDKLTVFRRPILGIGTDFTINGNHVNVSPSGGVLKFSRLRANIKHCLPAQIVPLKIKIPKI